MIMDAVAYLRVSTDEQSLGLSAQRAAIEAWAAREGAQVVSWHTDEDVSGSVELADRPALLVAVDAVSRGGVLVVAKLDRLARDVMTSAVVESIVRKKGASVVSAAGEGNGDAPQDQLMRHIVAAFAQYERAIIRMRIIAAMAVKRGRGERLGAIPFGKRLAADCRTLEDHPDERPVVDWMIAMRATGLSYNDICRCLRIKGFVTRSGKPFQPVQVQRALGEMPERPTARKEPSAPRADKEP